MPEVMSNDLIKSPMKYVVLSGDQAMSAQHGYLLAIMTEHLSIFKSPMKYFVRSNDLIIVSTLHSITQVFVARRGNE